MSGVSLLKMDGMGGRRGNGYAASWLLDVQHGLCFFEPSLPFLLGCGRRWLRSTVSASVCVHEPSSFLGCKHISKPKSYDEIKMQQCTQVTVPSSHHPIPSNPSHHSLMLNPSSHIKKPVRSQIEFSRNLN